MPKKNANLGMDFENMVNKKIEEYKVSKKAFGFKIPTEWVVQRRGKNIVSAFPKAKGHLDYIMVLPNGLAVIVEAKSSKDTSFPLKNIKDHQFDYAIEVSYFTKHCYYLIYMKKYNEVFLANASDIEYFRQTQERKSIPYSWFEQYCKKIEIKELNFLEEIMKNIV